jgi:hypothetical protein
VKGTKDNNKVFFKTQVREGVGTILVATTAGSSAVEVELSTDDCRQPAGITDESSFLYFFNGGR